MYLAMIVPLYNDQPELHTNLTTYTEMIAEQGFPAAHLQLLQDLKAWFDSNSASHDDTVQTVQRVLDIEAQFLIDAGVAGVASEHLAFLYTVVGEVFDDLGPDFRQVTQHEAWLAEQTYEDAISQHMRDTGCDRLEAVQYRKGVALERLQERHERIINLLRLLMGDSSTELRW